jgi:S1-C subfamily serine protease
VLKVPGLVAAPFVPSATPVRVGHLALAVARSWSNAVTASAGVVAVIGGPLPTGRRRAIDQVIRTTAPMHEGFSGGAFLDASGALVGMTTAAAIRGFGVVIPAAIVWKTAAHILEHGGSARGYLGIVGQPVRLPEGQAGAGARPRCSSPVWLLTAPLPEPACSSATSPSRSTALRWPHPRIFSIC